MRPDPVTGRRQEIRRLRVLLVALTALAALALSLRGTSSAQGIGPGGQTLLPSTPPLHDRPNIIMLMADDESVSDMRFMPKVRSLLAGRGVTFTNSFVSYPLCCPSRTTFLTGQYTHNHLVWSNLPHREGFQQFEHQNTTFPVALQDAGYRTFHVGKYLNGYGRDNPSQIPPGWNDWHASIDPTTYRYYGYRLNDNGVLRTVPAKPEFYSTDYYTQLATDFIRQRATQPSPFFLNLAYLAPHSGGGPHDIPGVLAPPPGVTERPRCPVTPPNARRHRSLYPLSVCEGGRLRRPVTDGFAVPAPRHVDAFLHAQLPRSPSFNESDISDKPDFMKLSGDFPRLTKGEIGTVTTMYRKRLASLLAIDDSVQRIIQVLEETHQLANTVIIYTSDHGFFLGQHRIPFGKYWPYEEAIRVPLIIRGPGIPANAVRTSPVINVDVAPTILAEARATSLRKMDGRSSIPLAQRPDLHWKRDILLEGNTGNAIPYEGVRTQRYVYVEYRRGARELYDLTKDPYELHNRAYSGSYQKLRRWLSGRLRHLRTCSGSTC